MNGEEIISKKSVLIAVNIYFFLYKEAFEKRKKN